MKYVYIIENETDACGAWSTPEKAVEACFDINENGMVEWGNGCISMEEAVQKMSAVNSDYPIISKVPIDPPDSKPRWGNPAEAEKRQFCWWRDS